MAKRNKVYIDVVIDDKGTTKKVALSQKQLGEAAAAAGNQVQNTDRRLKGAAQASSNATKNFSKMSQGISGGLVPAYATLAASLFAVSAVFQFLKDAGNLETLQAGQVAYAGATGIAMRTLTEDIIQATDAQIAFQDAASAASIGVAAGLSADVLTRLGAAAKSTSVILGRDVTDSFNRLVRGVTKAEPELLDELGIILRLDTAMENYKTQLGLGEVELNAFQRSQAVANEVLDQAENKFGRILKITAVAPNKFNKLGKAFDDILIQIKGVAAAVAGPFADVLIKTPELAGAAILLLVSGPLKAAIPGLQNMGEKTKEVAKLAEASFTKASDELERYKKSASNFELLGTKGAGGLKSAAAGDAADILKAANAGGGKRGPLRKLTGDVDKITNEVALKMKKGAMAGEGAYKKMSLKIRRDFISAMDDIIAANDIAAGKVSSRWEIATKKMQIGIKRTEVVFKGVFASIKAGAAIAARAVSIAFSAIGWIGIIYTLYEVIQGFRKTEEVAKESNDVFAVQRDRVARLVEDYKNFSAIQKILSEEGGNIISTYAAFGNLANSLSNSAFKNFGKALSESSDDLTAAREKAEDEVKRLERARDRVQGRRSLSFIEDRSAFDYGAAVDLERIQELTEEIAEAQKKTTGSTIALLAEMNPEKFGKFKEFLDIQIDSFNAQDESLIKNSRSANEYFNKLQALRAAKVIDKGQIEELLQARELFVEVSKGVAAYDKAITDVTKSGTTLVNKIMPVSEAQKYLTALNNLDTAIQKLEADQNNLNTNDPRIKGIQDRKARLIEERDLVTSIISFEGKQATELLNKRQQITANLRNADGITKSRLNTELKIFENDQKKLKLEKDIATLEETARINTLKLSPEELQKIKNLGIEIQLLEDKNNLARDALALQELNNEIRKIDTAADIAKTQRQAGFLITTQSLTGLQKQLAAEAKKESDLTAIIETNRQKILETTVDENGELRVLSDTQQELVDKLRAANVLRLAELSLLPLTKERLERQNDLADLNNAQSIKKIKLLTRQKILEAGLTAGQSRRQQIINQQRLLELEIRQSKEKELELRNAIDENTVSNVENSKRTLAIATATREQKQAELDILMRSTEAMEQYRLAIANGFESGLQQAINDLLTGAESSFRDSLLNLTKSVFETLAGKFSEIMADSMIDMIARSNLGSKIFRGMTLTDKVAEGHRKGAKILDTQLDTTSTNMATTLKDAFTNGAAALAETIRAACASCACDKANDSNMSEILNPSPANPVKTAQDVGEAAAKPLETATNEVKKVLNEETTFTETIKTSFSKFFEGAKGLGSDLAGFLKGFGTGLASFLKSFLASLTGVASGGGSILSTVFAVIGSIFTGGAAPVPLANGGVVDKPTYALIGEGRYNEAVIPMPDGKRVPVELKDKRIGSNQNNNVTVNVSMGEGGRTSTSSTQEESGRDAVKLGNIIAKAVQEELQNQKRSGGILSPYGAA